MTRQQILGVEIRVLRGFVLSLSVLAVLVLLAASALAQNPVPFVDQPLVPDAAAPGGAAFTLTVHGGGFVPASVVNWNGSPRITTFVSRSKLTATILASDITKASTADVTVVSPSPGGGVSNTQPFSINVPTTSVSFLPAVTYTFPGADPVSAAIADVNVATAVDAVVANYSANGTVSVVLGNGDGTFQPGITYDSGGPLPDSIAIADVNGDGKPDIVVANYCINSGCSANTTVGVPSGQRRRCHLSEKSGGSAGGDYADSTAVVDVNGDGKAIR